MSDAKGTTFWQNCAPPAATCVIRFEEGVAYTTDRNGVEYRRVRTLQCQQRRGLGAFAWQRKMWRMA